MISLFSSPPWVVHVPAYKMEVLNIKVIDFIILRRHFIKKLSLNNDP